MNKLAKGLLLALVLATPVAISFGGAAQAKTLRHHHTHHHRTHHYRHR